MNYYDSILLVSKTTKTDTQKVRMLNILSEELWQVGKYKQSQTFAEQAFVLADKNLVTTNSESQHIFLKEKANACNNLAIINRFLGDYTHAIKNHFTALKIREEIGDKKGVARSYLGIGSIYNFMGKNTEALDYKFKSKKIVEEINDSAGMAKVYNHIAYIFYDLNKYDSVDKYNNKSLMIYLKSFNIRGMADVFDLFGLTYLKKKEYKTALSLAKLIGSKEHQKNAYKGLYELDSITGNFTSAFANHKLYVTYRDSLIGQKTSETIAQLQGQFENEKRDQIRALEEKQKEAKRTSEEKQQKIILYSVCGGLLLMMVLAIVIYRGSKQKQKANIELLAKNEIIEQQKHTVEEKQKEIIDSIKYAKRIQNSLLPTEKYIDKSFKRLKD